VKRRPKMMRSARLRRMMGLCKRRSGMRRTEYHGVKNSYGKRTGRESENSTQNT